MTEATYPAGATALLFIDPYNDFLAEKGKMWPMVSAVAQAVDLHADLARVRAAARSAGLPIFILPHHQSEPTDFQGWAHPTPYQLGGPRPPALRPRQLGRRVASGLRSRG